MALGRWVECVWDGTERRLRVERGEERRDRGERGSDERVGACGSLMDERIVEQQMLSLVEFQEAPARGAGGAQAESVGA